MSDFEPLSRREIQNRLVLQEGKYHFDVVEAENSVSKKGNKMIRLKLRVYDDEGGSVFVPDWIMLDAGMRAQLKMLSFCESCGLEDVYATGNLADHDCLGASGMAQTGIEDSEEFGQRARIAYYFKPDEVLKKKSITKDDAVGGKSNAKAIANADDDDIPF